MKHSIATVTLLGLLAAGCTTTPLVPGEPEAAVVGKMGRPTHIYQDGNAQVLEYMRGPFGQQTYMARIGPDGKLSSFEQVLTAEKFATIKVDSATKEQVLRTIGAPGNTSYLPLRQLEVWSYAYKEANVWDSMMHVHFDKNGVVRQMMNGPDPSRDPDSMFGLSMMRRR
jgi:hypothetical protein